MGSGRNISDCLEIIHPSQVSSLTIIQCQQVNGFSLFLSNFSLFPLMLQRQYISYCIHAASALSRLKTTTICACSNSKALSSGNNLSASCISLLFFNSFFCIIRSPTFSKSSEADLIVSICIW